MHVIREEALNKTATKGSSEVSLGAFLELGGPRRSLGDESSLGPAANTGLCCLLALVLVKAQPQMTAPPPLLGADASSGTGDEKEAIQGCGGAGEAGSRAHEHQSARKLGGQTYASPGRGPLTWLRDVFTRAAALRGH